MRRRCFLSLRGWTYTRDLCCRISSSGSQSLTESAFLHLFSNQIVPSISSLPNQADLVWKNREIADEANCRHCSETKNLSDWPSKNLEVDAFQKMRQTSFMLLIISPPRAFDARFHSFEPCIADPVNGTSTVISYRDTHRRQRINCWKKLFSNKRKKRRANVETCLWLLPVNMVERFQRKF